MQFHPENQSEKVYFTFKSDPGMLSIAIPIYNQDVRALAYTLAKQCSKAGIPYQILCFDDGSQQKYRDLNRELGQKMHINYTEMPENLGRSRIRNWLGKLAAFDYILFLDGDSTVKSKDFIQKYLSCLPAQGILYGGRVYASRKPVKKKRLHWKYGRERESLPAKKRKKDPWLNFQSNNFLVPAQLFQQQPFDGDMEGYGYEDLLYAAELQKKGITITHIDNPVVHDGLETNTEFVKKTRQAIQNLALLYRQHKLSDTRLINTYEKIKNAGFLTFTERWLDRFQSRLEANNQADNPSMLLFSLWKLSLFIKLMQS